MVAYQNTLRGDGLGPSVGFAADGAGIIVDDNDGSNVSLGANLWNSGGKATAEAFGIYSGNSFHH